MISRPNSYLLISLIGIVGLFTIAATPVTGQDCTLNDLEVSKYLRQQMTNQGLSSQLGHLNVFVYTTDPLDPNHRTIRYSGYTDDATLAQKLRNILGASKCWNNIVAKPFYDTMPANGQPPEGPVNPQGGSCSGNTFKCGDICIPIGDACIYNAARKREPVRRSHKRKTRKHQGH